MVEGFHVSLEYGHFYSECRYKCPDTPAFVVVAVNVPPSFRLTKWITFALLGLVAISIAAEKPRLADPRTAVNRWRLSFQADFAKRMAWYLPQKP
jgi:hypothetical protein